MIDPTRHVGLIKFIALPIWKRMLACGVTVGLDDAIQEGHLALLLSERGFDRSRGIAESTFLHVCIQRHLNRWADGLIFKSVHETSQYMANEFEVYEVTHGRDRDPAELAQTICDLDKFAEGIGADGVKMLQGVLEGKTLKQVGDELMLGGSVRSSVVKARAKIKNMVAEL